MGLDCGSSQHDGAKAGKEDEIRLKSDPWVGSDSKSDSDQAQGQAVCGSLLQGIFQGRPNALVC